MRNLFWVFFAITGFLLVGAYAGYRAMAWSHNMHEGGDAVGPIGILGFIALILLSLLAIITAMITLGVWIGCKNHRKSTEHVLGLE